jgi:DnaK suppressor protein
MAEDKKFPEFTGKKQQYYELLMQARALVLGQFEFHSDEALKKNDSDMESRGMGTHIGDTDNSIRDMELQLMAEEGNVLHLIDEALDRLASDEFGSCIDCGADIGDGRLEVKPYAQYCIKCKKIREENDGMNPYFD